MGNTTFVGISKLYYDDSYKVTVMGVNYVNTSVFEAIDFASVFNESGYSVPFNIIEPYKLTGISYLDLIDQKSIELPYCVIDDIYNALYTVEHLNLQDLRSHGYDYVLREGALCRTLTTIKGSQVITSPDENGLKFVKLGRRVIMSIEKVAMPDYKRLDCCITQNASCPSNLTNMYITDDCDEVMSDYCKLNPATTRCITWMGSRRGVAINVYSELCSKNLNANYCTYFISDLRSNPFSGNIADEILHTYCGEHPQDTKCNCYNPPRNIVESRFVTRDAPYECWYEPCSVNSVDNKWLTSQQLESRRSCKVIDCVIKVGSITGDSITTLDNLCQYKKEYEYDRVADYKTQLTLDTELVQGKDFLNSIHCYILLMFVVCISLAFMILFKKPTITLKPDYLTRDYTFSEYIRDVKM